MTKERVQEAIDTLKELYKKLYALEVKGDYTDAIRIAIAELEHSSTPSMAIYQSALENQAVVYCKDCIYCTRHSGFSQYCIYHDFVPHEYDFCSMAERKEEKNE